MTSRLVAVLAATLAVTVSASGQMPWAVARVVRCAVGTSLVCLEVHGVNLDGADSTSRWIGAFGQQPLAMLRRVLPGDTTMVARLGAVGMAAMARQPLRGWVGRRTSSDTAVAGRLVWRPPLLAFPVFHGVADSAAFPPLVRDAFAAGAGLIDDRALIALLLVAVLLAAGFLLPRVFWRDDMIPPGDDMAPSPTLGAGPVEAPPRNAGDITKQTARGTALRR